MDTGERTQKFLVCKTQQATHPGYEDYCRLGCDTMQIGRQAYQTIRSHVSDDYSLNIVMCMSDYRRGLGWWLNLFTTYTLTIRDYALQITDTVYYSLH
jgi:hypothetical protein